MPLEKVQNKLGTDKHLYICDDLMHLMLSLTYNLEQ